MHRLGLLLQSRQVLGIHLQGRCIAQCHPGAAIELIGHGIELLLGVAAQIGALGEVLAQQPIGVFVTAAQPRAVGITEVHLHTRILGEHWRARPSPLGWGRL